MSLEKEPAGAFNKAQRLIEHVQYTQSSLFYKGASRFVFDRQLPSDLPGCWQALPIDLSAREWSRDASGCIARGSASASEAGDEYRGYYPEKSQ